MVGSSTQRPFALLPDDELVCLYRALTRLIELLAREEIPPERERAYGGRMTAIFASLDEPRIKELYRLGTAVHTEAALRGLNPSAPFQWSFDGLGAFVRTVRDALDRNVAA